MEDITNTLSKVKLESEDTSLDTKKKLLQEKLQHLECPLSWKNMIDEASNATTIDTALLEEKYQETENEKDLVAWDNIVLKLTLCYLYFNPNNLEKSKMALKDVEKVMSICSMPKAVNELSVPEKKAMEKVILAMKAFFEFYSKSYEEVEKILNTIKEDGEEDDKTKAAFLGIKAAILIEFPPRGSELAVSVLKKAISLDSDHAHWHFLLGKCLGRIRRMLRDNSLPSTEEIEALKKATELGNSATHIIFLAQTYRELAQSASFKKLAYLPTFNCSVHEINALSYKLYKKALDLEPNNCSVNNRCASGFQKLPPPFKDLELARKCAEKALSLSPNSPFVNETAGLLYCKLGDMTKALELLKLGGQLGSYTSYIMFVRIKYSRDRTWDPIPTLQDMQKKFSKEKVNEIDILLHIGMYYHFQKANFNTASKYWVEAIHLDPESKKLKDHRGIFQKKETLVNIYEILLTESQKRIRTAKKAEDRNHYQNIIELCSKYNK